MNIKMDKIPNSKWRIKCKKMGKIQNSDLVETFSIKVQFEKKWKQGKICTKWESKLIYKITKILKKRKHKTRWNNTIGNLAKKNTKAKCK